MGYLERALYTPYVPCKGLPINRAAYYSQLAGCWLGLRSTLFGFPHAQRGLDEVSEMSRDLEEYFGESDMKDGVFGIVEI